MSEKEILKKLAEAIVAIKISEKTDADKSDDIMELLRDCCLFVNEDYLTQANDNHYVTLDSDSTGIKFQLSKDDKVFEWYPIFGNSFGPFNPEEYFNCDFRILWLLKEPFIEKESWVKGDRGRHNQADEYVEWYKKYNELGNPTHDNILKLSRLILTELREIKESDSDEKVMSHICILEVNHFPGLAFNSKESNNSLIGKWAELNKSLIGNLMSFYKPSIILGGYDVLGILCEGTDQARQNLFKYLTDHSYSELISDSGYPDTTILHSQISASYNKEIVYTTQKGEIKSQSVSLIKDKNGWSWFATPHPSYGTFKNIEFREEFARWISEISKGNGEIRLSGE